MGHYGVKRCNVVETKLPECALQNLEASFFRCFVSGGRIYRLDNIVDLRRNQGIWARGVSDTFKLTMIMVHKPGNSRRYNFRTLAMMGSS